MSSDNQNNPFVRLFLEKHPHLSAAQARIAEEAWDAALDEAAEYLYRVCEISSVTLSTMQAALASTQQRNALASNRQKGR